MLIAPLDICKATQIPDRANLEFDEHDRQFKD